MYRAFLTLSLLICAGPAMATHEILADRILVEKSRHLLTLFSHGEVLHRYEIALGSGGLAPKRRQHDNLTPEGSYFIDGRNANSGYHLSLHISYPNARDTALAEARGVSPGGDIMIHGLPNGNGWIGANHSQHDWTSGCIATTDEEIEEIWRRVPDGTPIVIKP